MTASAERALTVVTAADQAYWRCLYQFLLSVERVADKGINKVVVFDLGIEPTERARLQKRFPAVLWRVHDLSPYPPHAQPKARTCAWKPVVIAEAMNEFGGSLLWLDSATLLRRPSTRVHEELRRTGIYSLVGLSPLFIRCHDETLRILGCDPDFFDRRERPAGVCAFDTDREAVRALILDWKRHSLDPGCIAPQDPPLREGIQHKWEQAILGVLLYQYEAREGLKLDTDEIDISSSRAPSWLSTRNKLSPEAPVWADPIYRAYAATWKAIDRASIRVQTFLTTRVDGFHRRTRERFEIRISRDGGTPMTVPCPGSRYFADPFLAARHGRRYLFFEDFDHATNRGRISALALKGAGPEVEGGAPIPVLERRFHLSFPFVFEHEGATFMLPESHENRTVDLYACDRFPDRFRLARRILSDIDAADSTLLIHQGIIWLFTSVRDSSSGSNRYLCILHSDDLLRGEFHPHPVNSQRLYAAGPNQTGRCAGPWVKDGDSWVRPFQANPDYYGQGLEWRRIVTLNREEYVEEPCPPPEGHNLPEGVSAHHISRLGDLTAFDVRTRHP